jgi:hypothetical protein
LGELPAGGPDSGPVQQGEDLEHGPPPFGDRQHLLGEPLGGVQVAPFQGDAR